MQSNQASTPIASAQQPDRTTTSAPPENAMTSGTEKKQEDPEQGLLEAGGDDVTGEWCEWPHKQVLLLIELYREHHDEMLHRNEHKYSRSSKKTVWQKIAAAMNASGYPTVSWASCDKKFRNLKIRYPNILDHHHKSGVEGGRSGCILICYTTFLPSDQQLYQWAWRSELAVATVATQPWRNK